MINPIDQDGFTPIYYAARFQYEILQYLLDWMARKLKNLYSIFFMIN